jgi:hypothetical protein
VLSRAFLRRIVEREWIQLDYDLLPAKVFTKAIKNILAKTARALPSDAILPVTAIGHVKTMSDARNVERILRSLTENFSDEIVFWTMRDAIEHMAHRSPSREIELAGRS